MEDRENLRGRPARIRSRAGPAGNLSPLLRAAQRERGRAQAVGKLGGPNAERCMTDEFESLAWKTAKTYADAPHEYVLAPDQEGIFDGLGGLLKESGEELRQWASSGGRTRKDV